VDLSLPWFILAPASHLFGTAGMFQILGDQNRPWLGVFRTFDETYAALGIASSKYEPLEEMEGQPGLANAG
jgi:hypothetical protein